MYKFQRIMQEAVFGTLREVSAFSRDVEDQQVRGETVPFACIAVAGCSHSCLQQIIPLACMDAEDDCAGATEIEALNQMMRELEQRDGDGDAEGHGDLLDDFVSSALVKVTGLSIWSL